MLATRTAGCPLTTTCLPTKRQNTMLAKLLGPNTKRNVARLLILGPVAFIRQLTVFSLFDVVSVGSRPFFAETNISLPSTSAKDLSIYFLLVVIKL